MALGVRRGLDGVGVTASAARYFRSPDLDVPERDVVAVILQADVAGLAMPYAGHALNLLAATLRFPVGLPNSYSTTFAPLSQCSTWVPLDDDAAPSSTRRPACSRRPSAARQTVVGAAEAVGTVLGVGVAVVVEHLDTRARCSRSAVGRSTPR